MKIAIRNFQSIVKSNIDLNGIVCLVASNNEGKTAHIRALRALITNSSNKDQIRVGSSEFIVGLQLDNMEIHYKRGKTVQYHVNGEDYTKIGRDSLDKVFQGSGLLYDRESDFPVLPQFIFQKETPFPFNLTPSKMYSQFSKFFGVDKLEVVMKSVAEDLREEKGELKYKQGQHDSLSTTIGEEISRLKKMPTVEQINELRGQILVREQRIVLLNQIKELMEQGKKIQNQLVQVNKKLNENKAILDRLSPVVIRCGEILNKVVVLGEYLDQIQIIVNNYSSVESKIVSLKTVDFSKCGNTVDKYNALLSYRNDLNKFNKCILLIEKNAEEFIAGLNIQKQELSKYVACPLCEAPVKNGKYFKE